MASVERQIVVRNRCGSTSKTERIGRRLSIVGNGSFARIPKPQISRFLVLEGTLYQSPRQRSHVSVLGVKRSMEIAFGI